MKLSFMPKTYLGKWSIRLIIAFFLLFGIFWAFITSGQRGGDTFFSNLFLTVPFLLAALSGIFAFFTGIISIAKKGERSIFVFLVTLLGFFILLFVSAEILFPH
jgi:amino acid permease